MSAEWPKVCRTLTLKEKLKTAKVLAVGAGGIGCELLKTLVLTGFENIQVIDMDTIETSNLNRQFLFRKRHVGESKAVVAAKAVQQFRPSAVIQAHQANIKEPQYGVDFFKGFDIVLNGLDNLEARRHVNRLCLAARTPLVESGTAGYLGQVSVHLRIRDAEDKVTLASECFECQPKAAPKTFPVCTIRNTPDKPIHCIVWAKDLLFQRLFGSPEAVTDLDERRAGEGAGEANGEGEASTSGEAAADPSEFVRREGEDSLEYAARIFERMYNRDIESVLSMEELWKSRQRPQSMKQLTGTDTQSSLPTLQTLIQSGLHTGDTASSLLGLKDHHKTWNTLQNVQAFLLNVVLYLETRGSDVGSAVFDKDDDLAVEFVTAASNLRALCYHIPSQSLFAAKGMAGNIIHAIATTNATIAGMIVVEAVKVLAGLPIACKMSYLHQNLAGKRMITAMTLSEPSPSCVVCGASQLQLTLHTGNTTLATFIDKVLKKRLAMNEPTVMCGGLAYEEGADLDPEEVADNAKLLPLPLEQLPGGGIRHGSIVSVSDQAQDFSCQLVISHKEEWDEEREPDGFLMSGAVPQTKADVAAGTNGNQGKDAAGADDSDDSDLEIVGEPAIVSSGKRKREAVEEGDGPQPKKRAQDGAGGAGPIQID